MKKFFLFIFLLLLGTCVSILERKCDDEKGCEVEGTGCLESNNCGYWDTCNENYECVPNLHKNFPRRECNKGLDCHINLYDGKCYVNSDCYDSFCGMNSKEVICSKEYLCVCKY